jgi:hypothetical protein
LRSRWRKINHILQMLGNQSEVLSGYLITWELIATHRKDIGICCLERRSMGLID